MHSISKNLKQIRQQRGWTQQQMADMLFVTRQTVSNWENGKSMPDLNMLTDISEKLDIDVNTLLYGPMENDIDIKNNMIVSSILVMSAIISYLWLVPYVNKICNVTFCSFNIYLIYLIIFPIFSFSAAMLAMQVAKFKNIIPYSFHLGHRKNIRKLIRVSIIVYSILLAPCLIYEFTFFLVSFSGVVLKCSANSRFFRILTNLQNIAGGFLQTMFILPVYSKVFDFILAFMYKSHFIAMGLYAFAGAIYELSEPRKNKNADSSK